MKTDMMETCGRCGDEYERYMVLLERDGKTIQRYKELQSEYGGICRDCRRHEMAGCSYAMEDY